MDNPLHRKTANTFPIRQAIVGMGMESADDRTLHFLAVLNRIIPVESICFLHVQPAYDLVNVMYEKEAEALLSNFDFQADVLERIRLLVGTRFNGVQTTPVVMEGDPLAVLLEQTSAMHADLLVVGKQTGGVTHGILSGNLVRKTACDTLVVPDKSRMQIKRIFVPLDFSAYSIRALQFAAALFEQSSGKLEVVLAHALELPSIMAYRLGKTQEELRKILEADRRAALEDFVRNFASGLMDHVLIELMHDQQKSIGERILEAATEHAADLIIMGAKGHSRVELLLMGSVAESVLQMDDHIPVWVVK
jgi:nucleotide-binding universal stress UspA family protein